MSHSRAKLDLRLKWLGCACFELDFGTVTVVNDPWITKNTCTNLTWESVEKCDYITLTHGHYDHTLDIPALVKKFDPYIFCGENTAIPLMKWANLNPMKVYSMTPGLELNMDDFKIKALFGQHTQIPGSLQEKRNIWANHAVNQNNQELIDLGCWGDCEYRNFLFTTPNGAKVFIWGSMLSRPDQRNIIRELKPDVAILQITGRNEPELVAQICKEAECKVLIPNHIDFPRNYIENVRELGLIMAEKAPEITYIVPEYGKWISL